MTSWILFSLLSAATAALVAIFGKIGLKGVDPTLATTWRALVMAIFMFAASISLKKFDNFHLSDFSGKEWLYIVLAGVAGAASWLFYFIALKAGDATRVSAIDRLSIVLVVFLSALFLGESLTWKSVTGAALIAIGATFIAWK